MSIDLVSDTIDKTDIRHLIEWLDSPGMDVPQLTKGPITPIFEHKFANWLGNNNSVFVNSGSSAILLGLAALKFGGKLKNNKIVVPDLSWATDVSSPLLLGMDTYLVDCNMHNLSADCDHLEQIFREERPAAFILVSVLGLVPNMHRIHELCDKYDVLLIEDVCESMGSKCMGQKLGTFGIMSFFSLYFGHHISTIEGGMVATNNVEINDLLLMMRSHGWDRDLSSERADIIAEENGVGEFDRLFSFYLPGLNVRATDLQAVIGLRQVDKIDNFAKIRNKNFLHFNERLANSNNLIKPNQHPGDFVSSFCYPILLNRRDECVAELKANNIACRPLIAGSISKSAMWKKFGSYTPNNRNASTIDRLGFYVPNHQGMTTRDVDKISDIILKY
jgi:CDP-6-deoxy-D-xylo-4-hexulose-3-dehydrase